MEKFVICRPKGGRGRWKGSEKRCWVYGRETKVGDKKVM